jgi:hypothetical protein
MARFKQGMARFKFADLVLCFKYLVSNLERLILSKEWLVCVKCAASPPHLRHHNEPRCAETLRTKQNVAA